VGVCSKNGSQHGQISISRDQTMNGENCCYLDILAMEMPIQRYPELLRGIVYEIRP
jgi:hypothetical protein